MGDKAQPLLLHRAIHDKGRDEIVIKGGEISCEGDNGNSTTKECGVVIDHNTALFHF